MSINVKNNYVEWTNNKKSKEWSKNTSKLRSTFWQNERSGYHQNQVQFY